MRGNAGARKADKAAKLAQDKAKRALGAAAKDGGGNGGGNKRRNVNQQAAQLGAIIPAPAAAPAGKTLFCSFHLAHALGVLDSANRPVLGCNKPKCPFTHRGKPSAPLSQKDRAQWIADYSFGTLPFKDALLAAITNLP